MNRSCCLIGGTGFLGSSLIPILLKSGRTVRVIGRSKAPVNPLPEGVTYMPGDYGDRAFLAQALEGMDEAVDLAYSTVPKTSFDDPVLDIQTNLPQSVNLFQLASELKMKRLVVVSSGGTVYGQARNIPIGEDHPTDPISPYGITKLTIEKYAHMFFRLKNLPVICVRPGNAYGENQKPFRGQGFVSTAIASILEGKEITLFGETGTVRDYIHADDIADGILAALDSGNDGETYNIGTGIGCTNRGIMEILAPLAAQSDMKIRLSIQPERSFDVKENILDCSLLKSHSGWFPRVALKEGLARVWNHFLRLNQSNISR